MSRLAAVVSAAVAIVLILICFATWQSVLSTKMEIRDLKDGVAAMMVDVKTINIITGDIHTFTYKMLSDQDVDRARAGRK
jgi:HAMP domain-containing protein